MVIMFGFGGQLCGGQWRRVKADLLHHVSPVRGNFCQEVFSNEFYGEEKINH